MRLRRSLRKLEDDIETLMDTRTGSSAPSRAVLRNIGWVSAGITVLAVGVVIGREVRARYKFSRLTPYDVYARAGRKPMPDVEFGVGV